MNRNDNLVPRLHVGAGPVDGSAMCAMQVISWENGDTTITDLPGCADPTLARIVQQVNDRICTHRDADLLCPACSVQVLALAHRTVGTGLPADADKAARLDRRRVWVRVAADQARQVLHLTTEKARPNADAAIRAAEAWAADPSEENRKAASAAAAYAASYAASTADAAAYAASYAAASAADADAYAASYASDAASAADAYASYAASDAASAAAAYAAAARLRLTHRAIDTFLALTGHTEQQPDPQRTAAAVAAMTTTH